MQLVRVEVRNIRSYETARLDLGGGTTLLVGDVGSGKTSLLFAVEMALFGTAEIDATYLVRHGATEATVLIALEDGEHRYEIERTFRRVRRKGREILEPGRLSFRRDGSATSYSATELRHRVIELLGFRDNPNPRAHSDLWRWAVYVPQERMREILAAAPLERLETVRRALGVERYRTAAENAKEVARDLRRTSSTLRAQAATLREFSEDLTAASAEVRHWQEEGTRIEGLLRSIEVELGRSRELARGAERGLQVFDPARRRLADLGGDEGRDLSALEEAARRRVTREQEVARGISELEALTALERDEAARREVVGEEERSLSDRRQEVELASVAEARLTAARDSVQARSIEVIRIEEERDRTRADAARAEAGMLETAAGAGPEPARPNPASRAEVGTELERQRRAEQSATETLAVARQSFRELHELTAGGVCPRCHQTVRTDEFARHEGEAQAQVATAEFALAGIEAERVRWEAVRRQLEDYETERARWESLLRRHQDAQALFGQAAEALTRSEARLRDAEAAAAEAKGAVELLLLPAGSLLSARGRLTSTERRVQEARERLEESRRARDRRADLSERLRSWAEEAERESRAIEATRRRREERQHEVAELNATLATEPGARAASAAAQRDLATRETERHRAAEERGRVSGLGDAALTRQRRAEAAQVERDRLNHRAETVDSQAEWLAHAFHDAVLTMELRVLEHAQTDFEQTFRSYFAALIDDPDLVAVTDSTFSPAAEIRGVETPAEALSGGERTSLALAYRLALSRVVRSLGSLRFDALLLDEPTDGFSPEQVLSMGELLEELRLPQVLLVSHERELEAIADRVVRVEKENGSSVLRGPGVSAADPGPESPT